MNTHEMVCKVCGGVYQCWRRNMPKGTLPKGAHTSYRFCPACLVKDATDKKVAKVQAEKDAVEADIENLTEALEVGPQHRCAFCCGKYVLARRTSSDQETKNLMAEVKAKGYAVNGNQFCGPGCSTRFKNRPVRRALEESRNPRDYEEDLAEGFFENGVRGLEDGLGG